MGTFSVYFAASPLKFLIGLVLLVILVVSFIRGKQVAWKKMGLKRDTRFYISAALVLLYFAMGFNIGHRQADLHREQFDTPMATTAPALPAERSIEKPNAQESFDIQLNKSKKENAQ
ncbi:hypothetical protein AVA65_07885 [Salmonella enterica subsp. enterica serovar Minnesota]|nr:hypothetical protein [Salmonella enterica subsp. enterica serovar Minnesota]